MARAPDLLAAAEAGRPVTKAERATLKAVATTLGALIRDVELVSGNCGLHRELLLAEIAVRRGQLDAATSFLQIVDERSERVHQHVSAARSPTRASLERRISSS